MPLHPSMHDPVQRWMRQQALPLRTIDPQASLEDLAPFEKVVGNASIVGLGEASHGAHEFFVLKHRLLRFLVEQMGFTHFAMEANWMGCEPIQEYLLTGQGDLKALLGRIGNNIWKTHEVFDLLSWIRTYNADPQHSQKVSFAGVDCGSVRKEGLEKIVQFFQVVDPAQREQVEQLYSGLETLSWKPRPKADIAAQSLQAAQRVSALLRDHRPLYSQRSSPEQWAAILQEARIVEQVMELLVAIGDTAASAPEAIDVSQLRDAFMAENIAWLHEQVPAGKKMVLWAHNWHIGLWGRWGYASRGNDRPYTWMGMHLRERYHEGYLPIGFSFFDGSLNAVLIDGDGKYLSPMTWEPRSVNAALPESYNAALAQAGPLFLLDLRSAPAGEVQEWLAEPHPFRSFDTDYCSDERLFYELIPLSKYLDAVIQVQTISPSQMLAPLKLS